MPEWPQPGWYFEPSGPQVARWWDGQSWGPYASPPPVVPTSDPYQQAAPWGSPHAQQTAVLQQPPPSPPAQWVPSTPTPRGSTSPGVRIGAVLGAVVLVVGFIYVWHQGDQPSHGQASPASSPTPTTVAVAPTPSALTTIGPPNFTRFAAPPAHFEGQAKIISANGAGDYESPAFTLHGGPLDGGMAQVGQGAGFYLDPGRGAELNLHGCGLREPLLDRRLGKPGEFVGQISAESAVPGRHGVALRPLRDVLAEAGVQGPQHTGGDLHLSARRG